MTTGLAPRVGEPQPGPRATATRSVAGGALALLTTQPLTWAVSLASAVLLPQLLGASDLGLMAVALTLAGFVGVVCALGVPNVLIRRIAVAPEASTREISTTLALVLTTTVAAATVLCAAALLLPYERGKIVVLQLALVGAVAAAIQNVLMAALNGQERHARYAWLNALISIAVTLIGLGVLLVSGSLAAFLAVSALVVAVFALAGWYRSGFGLSPASVDLAAWRTLVRGGLPFLGMSVTMRLRAEIDRPLLALLASTSAVGWYAAAYRIISIPLFIPTLIITPLLPALSRNVERRAEFDLTLQRSVRAVLMLTVPVFGLIAALAPGVPHLLGWGDAFAGSVPLIVILSIQQPLVALDMVLGTALVALRRERIWAVLTCVSAAANVALNVALVPLCARAFDNGAIGAAISTVATEGVLFVGALVLIPRQSLGGPTLSAAARILVAGLLMALTATLLRPVSFIGAAVAAPMVFCLAVLGTGALRPAELREIVAFGRTLVAGKLGRVAAGA